MDDLHSIDTLKHMGIDKNFIAQNANVLNKELEKKYNEYPASQKLAEPMIQQPMTQANVTSMAEPEPQPMQTQEAQTATTVDTSQIRQQMQHFAKEQADRVEAQVMDSLQDLASQFTKFAQQMEQKLDALEQKAGQMQAQPQMQQQQSAPAAPQPATPAPQAKSEPQQQGPTPTNDAEMEKLKESVSIDKIFNCSGKR